VLAVLHPEHRKCTVSHKKADAKHGARKFDPDDTKHFVGGSAEGKRAFIAEIVAVFRDAGADLLKVQLSLLLEHLGKLDTTCDANLYRKAYGNLPQIFHLEDFKMLFTLDSEVLCLNGMPALERANKAGVLSDALLATCDTLHQNKEMRDLQTMKTNSRNVCARCGGEYSIFIGAQKLCSVHASPPDTKTHKFACCHKASVRPGCHEARHAPSYDWKSAGAAVSDLRPFKVDYKVDLSCTEI